ncbi:aminotransferase class I/II-fold pyridoxal phosphate-dependent enzyme [Canibacter sp. lx-45]|uniref:aminotransferase class I/II-fold pyridoxal phosphate-dependent enzyme n=1 Tax=Canibacter zhuwentaonis TaxID=2837491 RepID=UPI001BDCAA76|nr:aminotransferase class I/II-fold pyridoxal phosphate-dependent enzyme [Canibacter zhuwentaonis]MBT1035407.1 aminotransferase class I/II-fold pyridoxal phosphate-dependent enzyme [Canibacter zhuwentaonis]
MEAKNPPIIVRPDVLAVPPYKQGKALRGKGFKLSSNESHEPPPQRVLAAIAQHHELNRYADPNFSLLRERIAAEYGGVVTSDWVQLGVGSAALLYQLVHATAGGGDNYVHAWPSFEAYPLLGVASGAKAVAVPLTYEAKHDLPAMAEAITARTRVVLLCTPNNPTGPIITRAEFTEFMREMPERVLVILDEAYAEYVTCGEAVRGTPELLVQHPNLLILRTFSKAKGLAGLRIGYGIAAPEIWRAVFAVQIPLAINSLSAIAAQVVLDDAEVVQELVVRNAATIKCRSELVKQLGDLGFSVPQTQGNFVWLPAAQISALVKRAKQLSSFETLENSDQLAPDAPDSMTLGDIKASTALGDSDIVTASGDPATALADALVEAAIIVRAFPGAGVRISVGEPESIGAVTRAIKSFLEHGNCDGFAPTDSVRDSWGGGECGAS